MDSTIITHEDCKKILTKKLNTTNFILNNFELQPVTNDAIGFNGQYFILKLSYKVAEKTSSDTFFCKIPTKIGVSK